MYDTIALKQHQPIVLVSTASELTMHDTYWDGGSLSTYHAVRLNDGFALGAATDKAPIDRAIRGLAELEECYYKAPGAVPGTAYGLVQGVTRFVDHSRGKDSDKRLTSAWFGQGETLKQQAVEKALALA
jgi:hypothetical protein